MIIESTSAGPGVLRRRRAGEDEDAGADDRADAERGEVQRTERAAERRPLGFGLELGDAAGSGEGHGPYLRDGERAELWGCDRIRQSGRQKEMRSSPLRWL